MKSLFVSAFIFFPFFIWAQGIAFEQGLSWKQIRQKATAEHKYIFVDCAASWCKPCKQMEKDVFPLKEVGDFANEHFVSVHVQMDTTKADDENTKAWYGEAHQIGMEYGIKAFPTYLFFTPDGKIVHRGQASMGQDVFIRMLSNSMDPDHQYYTLRDQFAAGERNYKRMPYLSTLCLTIGEREFANKVAEAYINYLNTFGIDTLLREKNLRFIDLFATLIRSADPIFHLFYMKPELIDNASGKKGFSTSVIDRVITHEAIMPVLWPGGKPAGQAPDWAAFKRKLDKKYGKKYAELPLIYQQIAWFGEKKDFPNQIKYFVEKNEKYGLDTAGIGWAGLNNILFDLFLPHCNNVDTLNKAIGWMEIVNRAHPDDPVDLDTYANLLYKAGRTGEAIKWEEKALELDAKEAENQNRKPDATYATTINKMKSGTPTWENN